MSRVTTRMKKPKTPPSMETLVEEIVESSSLENLLTAIPRASTSSDYHHWDKLVHRKPPEGLTHGQWWFLLKTQRRGLAKSVPLLDKDGKTFSYCLSDPVPERLHQIDQGAGGLIQMPTQITNPDTRDRYYVSSLIEEAITSSQLEGAVTTREVARDMLRSGRAPRDKSERMILNNFLTMKHINEIKDKPLTRELVFDLHRLVTDRTLDKPGAGGRFRGSDEEIVVDDQYGEIMHVPPPATQLEERMEAMCKFANGLTPDGFVHPAIRSIILHFWLGYDHPFVDGKGRTARALFYWSMLRHGFWLFEFVTISHFIVKAPVKYARAYLYTETDDNDLTYFIRYHLEIVRMAIEGLHEYIKRKSAEVQALERELRAMVMLNHRQRDLIGHALRHPRQHYTIESHRSSHNVVYETARTDLLNLVDRGLLQVTKQGKALIFTPVSALEEMLRGNTA